MFVLNVIMAATGYIIWGSVVVGALVFGLVHIVHWFTHDETVGEALDREIEMALGPRQLSLFDDDRPAS